jgi:hypothetical protein
MNLRRMLWEMEAAEAAAHSEEDEDHNAGGNTWMDAPEVQPRRQTATVRTANRSRGDRASKPEYWSTGANPLPAPRPHHLTVRPEHSHPCVTHQSAAKGSSTTVSRSAIRLIPSD